MPTPSICPHCGRLLETKIIVGGIDEYGREWIEETILFCPKYKFSWLSHYKKVYDEDGNLV